VIPRAALALCLVLGGLKPADYTGVPGGLKPEGHREPGTVGRGDLVQDLDLLFSSRVFSRALVAVRVDSLRTGETLYRRNADKLVVPASNLKLFTLAVAAERLGWDHRFDTRLEAAGSVADGVLSGDLVVVGGGDPSIVSPDLGHPALFLEWAAALRDAGIRRIDGRLIGDDNAFDDRGLGAGWSWDYLTDGYAAPSGALAYNEAVVAVRVMPGRAEGDRALVSLAPPGAPFGVDGDVRSGPPGSAASVSVARAPGSSRLTVTGRVPAGGPAVTRETPVENPTSFFVEALRLALAERGVMVAGGAWDVDDLAAPVAALPRRVIARRASPPLASLGAEMLKTSQNFYAEMLLKAIGRTESSAGSAASGRQVVRTVLSGWGIGPDSYVMNDGSGLSRYDYVTSDAITALLTRVWRDERLRGPFVAALPVGGHDGTLAARMRTPDLDRRVQAKTGTIANMRALSGYLETGSGEKLVFSIIVNHHTATTAEVDGVVEQALTRLVQRSTTNASEPAQDRHPDAGRGTGRE
jgi:D-alanyl-D-alanine carboxypeptidase/D-alanyl-D-alanine-endopeptidase (penicillin-binding protein 4)